MCRRRTWVHVLRNYRRPSSPERKPIAGGHWCSVFLANLDHPRAREFCGRTADPVSAICSWTKCTLVQGTKVLEFCKWIGVFTLIIKRGFECGVKPKRQLFIFKLNDEASLSCRESEEFWCQLRAVTCSRTRVFH